LSPIISIAQKVGALILFERKDRLHEFVTGGIPFEAEPAREIIFSTFQKDSLLHDGAVLMHNGRIFILEILPKSDQPIETKSIAFHQGFFRFFLR
jgi:DNA integrity scanning protein DisA with diadenylate cyclase activity